MGRISKTGLRKYKCYSCGVTDENWSSAPWTRSKTPQHYTCGRLHDYNDRYKFAESFIKIVKYNKENNKK